MIETTFNEWLLDKEKPYGDGYTLIEIEGIGYVKVEFHHNPKTHYDGSLVLDGYKNTFFCEYKNKPPTKEEVVKSIKEIYEEYNLDDDEDCLVIDLDIME